MKNMCLSIYLGMTISISSFREHPIEQFCTLDVYMQYIWVFPLIGDPMVDQK